MKILTGIKPTAGQMHIGNYLGAVKPLIDLASHHSTAKINLFVPSSHAYTSLAMQASGAIVPNTINFLKTFVAAGADLDRYLLYDQRHISAHTQLTRILTCLSHMGMLERMHAYKDAVVKGKASEIGAGVFLYPVLMAADILLYDATHVPVGQDQKQHVELARDLAEKFNHLYGNTFVIPEAVIGNDVGIIPGIDGRKMSKSYNNFIGIMDDDDTVFKKIRQISTDMKTVEEPKDPDTCAVFAILKHFLTDSQKDALTQTYRAGGMSYKRLKDYAFEIISGFLHDIQKKYHAIDEDGLLRIVSQGTERARHEADQKIQQVNKMLGYL